MSDPIDRIIYVHGFKIGDNESCDQDCLVSLNYCSILDYEKFIKYSFYEKLQKEIEDLKAELEKERFPRNVDRKNGWDIEFDYLNNVMLLASESVFVGADMEQVEAIILAHEELARQRQGGRK